MARGDALAPVVTGDVTSQHDHLNGQVLHDGGEINRRVVTDAGGIVPLAQVPGDAADGELEAARELRDFVIVPPPLPRPLSLPFADIRLSG